MKTTDVKINRLLLNSKVKAIVSITFDDELTIHSAKLILGENGLFVAMPHSEDSNGKYWDVVHPRHSELRDDINICVIRKYFEATSSLASSVTV